MSSNIEIQKKCKWCGQIFIARKTSTNYCSHKCNNAAYKERIRQERIATYQKEISINAEETSIENKEFYTPPEVAKLLGISRASIYRYMAENIIKAVQFKGKTLVRRKLSLPGILKTYRWRKNLIRWEGSKFLIAVWLSLWSMHLSTAP